MSGKKTGEFFLILTPTREGDLDSVAVLADNKEVTNSEVFGKSSHH